MYHTHLCSKLQYNYNTVNSSKHTWWLISIHHSTGSTQSLKTGRHTLCKHYGKVLVKRRANHQHNRLMLAQQARNLFWIKFVISHKDTNITLSLDHRSSMNSKVGHVICVLPIHLKNLVLGCCVFQRRTCFWDEQPNCIATNHSESLASFGAGMVTLHFVPLAFIVSRLNTFLTYVLHLTVKYVSYVIENKKKMYPCKIRHNYERWVTWWVRVWGVRRVMREWVKVHSIQSMPPAILIRCFYWVVELPHAHRHLYHAVS